MHNQKEKQYRKLQLFGAHLQDKWQKEKLNRFFGIKGWLTDWLSKA